MSQFDTFIFSSNLFYFILSFFILLFVNYIIPKYGALLKLRVKIFINHYNTISIGVLLFFIFFVNMNLGLIDILSLFVDDQDSFGVIVITISVIAFTEFIYYKFNGHHSYLFANMLAGHILLHILAGYILLHILYIPSQYSYICLSIPLSVTKHSVWFKNIKPILLSLLFILIFTIITMLIPQLLLILAILSSIFVFFLYFEEIPLKLFKKDIIVAFLVFLNTVGILKILFNIHSYIFLHCSKRIFNIILFASNILHLCYIVLARYYVYITVFEPLILRWSYVFLFTFLLFITYLGLISKFLINTTHIIIMACYTRQPSLLLVDPTDVPPPNTSNNKGTHLSLFSYHQHQPFPPQFPRVSSWVKGGVICTAIGASAACVAVYYYHRSTKAAELSAKAAERSADATCVQAGLMTKEEFHGKWSTTGSSDTMVSPLEIWL